MSFQRKILMTLLAVSLWTSPGFGHTHNSGHTHSSDCAFRSQITRPVRARFSPGPFTQEQFETTLKKFNDFFQPDFNRRGLHLRIVSEWDYKFVTAYATINDALPIIRFVNISGAMARYEAITQEGLDAVVCHEIGHHLGGAPTREMNIGRLSNEGQADYYTTLKCLRQYYEKEDNLAYLKGKKISKLLQDKCSKAFEQDIDQIALCIRVALAGKAAADLSAALEREKSSHEVPEPKFATPSKELVSETRNGHSQAQCRLDTFLQGAICTADLNQPLSNENAAQGACSRSQGDQEGVRPLCWYKPEQPVSAPTLAFR